MRQFKVVVYLTLCFQIVVYLQQFVAFILQFTYCRSSCIRRRPTFDEEESKAVLRAAKQDIDVSLKVRLNPLSATC
jgi:hypothetical protein